MDRAKLIAAAASLRNQAEAFRFAAGRENDASLRRDLVERSLKLNRLADDIEALEIVRAH